MSEMNSCLNGGLRGREKEVGEEVRWYGTLLPLKKFFELGGCNSRR